MDANFQLSVLLLRDSTTKLPEVPSVVQRSPDVAIGR